ncbi:MAG: Trehalose/maltose import ATP-binding protein MalK [Methanomassiliicoccales archaeon PtaU1.Bin124]|nr:MAG: Trehalose/maltose import ATP-binding protein MalK [Methanomassiliicoccales archaeon PtaU1.Bin124]
MPVEKQVFVSIDNISKSFNGNLVLRDISANLSAGETLGLIGRSGAGKSVLIHALRGTPEYKPDQGSIIYRINYCQKCNRVELPNPGQPCPRCGSSTTVREVDFWNMADRDPLRMAMKERIAIMLQRTFALYGESSVIENIFEALGDMEEKAKVERAIELLKMVRLEHRTMHIARDLSGGEKQRVVLARQLARDPILFLADEPTGTLDPQTADLVHKALVEAVRSGRMAMVVSSHWPKAINQLSNKAMWLESGEIMKMGAPTEVTKEFEVCFQKTEAMMNVTVGQPTIRLEGAKKYFYSIVRGVVKAVDDVSFEVKEKEIFGLVGLSGAGKTTVSRMISGIAPATGGLVAVRIGDEWINMSEMGEMGRGRATPYIGMLHQEYSLYPFNTVLQNLTVCIGMKLPAELAKMKAIQVLTSVGFTAREVDRILYALPDTLSVGEKQRIALARVLIQEPRFVILDEPTGTMDPITKNSVAKSILIARKELGETFIIVSHDMDFVLDCCDRVALMKGGKVVALGSPKDVVATLTEGELAEYANNCEQTAEGTQ